jgi:hypothetical protein
MYLNKTTENFKGVPVKNNEPDYFEKYFRYR